MKSSGNNYSVMKTALNMGLAQGRAEGRAESERDKALELARQMKADGMPAELIAKYTGLTLEVVNSL